MRKVTFLFILSLSISCFSQNKQLLYNFTTIPQSLMTNPGADFKYKWYAGVPLVSGFSANIGSSGFSAFDLFANDGVDFNTKLRNIVFSVSRNDKILINEQLEIFNGGFKINRDYDDPMYLSFGMYQELDFLLYMPKDLAILALYGNRDYLGKVFNLGDANVKGELLSVFHLGINKKINQKVILGARGKIYSSIFNIYSTKNSGYLYTVPAENEFYKQVIASNLNVNTSGFTNYTENYSGNAASDIQKKTLLGGNLGLGFDFGFTYYPKDNIQITASLVDVGFIRHTKQVENYSYKGIYVQEGVQPDFINPSLSNESLGDKFSEAIPSITYSKNYTSWRPIKLNASYQYSFGESENSGCNCNGNEMVYMNSIGAQLYMMTTPRIPIMAITAYYRKRISDALELKGTYTLDSFSSKNIGLGLSTTLSKVNFYFLADNLLEYRDLSKAKSLSFQLGLNVIFADKNNLD
ncbi:DUF5723 family protein [Flavobacterium sp.]|uniref:DUF5723 family protein n=1 Tax=Flavobacterium sp. TaxID=239 RepID=UPI0038FD3D9C